MLEPTTWPPKNAPTTTGKVINCQPSPEKIRSAITKGTGKWIDRSHCTENFLTLARQYPNGRLKTKTIIATIQMFM